MNYVIRYAFTKENPTPYKTQAEIISSNLIPLIGDKSFLERKISFYIRRENLTGVTLSVYIEEKNLREAQRLVGQYTSLLKPNSHDGWTGKSEETDFFLRTPFSCQERFYKYLEDITWIGISLHKRDLAEAISFAVRAKFETLPFGLSNPREFFHDYFLNASERYQNKNQLELDEFWSRCGFHYEEGTTYGSHFYYNIVLGVDFSISRPFLNQGEREQMINSKTQEVLKFHGF